MYIGMTIDQNQSKQFMKVYYRTKKCELTEIFLTINQTTKSGQ